MVELLVGYGADLNIQDHEMATPLHIITHLTGKNLGDLGLGLSESLSPDLLKVKILAIILFLSSYMVVLAEDYFLIAFFFRYNRR